jgi:hypothetical protein
MRPTWLCAFFFALPAQCADTSPEAVVREQQLEQQNERLIVEQQSAIAEWQSRIEADRIKAEFWHDSPLTESQYEDDVELVKQATPRQWNTIRSLKAGLAPSKEDEIQLKMLTRNELRAIVEMASWFKWKDQWEAQKKTEIQADYNRQQEQQFEQQELNLRRFEALEAARSRTTDCYRTLFGGVSCTEN